MLGEMSMVFLHSGFDKSSLFINRTSREDPRPNPTLASKCVSSQTKREGLMLLWEGPSATTSPVRASRTRNFFSLVVVAICVPSGLHAQLKITSLCWSFNTISSFWACTSQIRTVGCPRSSEVVNKTSLVVGWNSIKCTLSIALDPNTHLGSATSSSMPPSGISHTRILLSMDTVYEQHEYIYTCCCPFFPSLTYLSPERVHWMDQTWSCLLQNYKAQRGCG